MNHSINNLYLSIGSFFGSLGSFAMWFITNNYVLAVMGFVALCVSITAGVLTIKKERLSMQIMREQLKNKSGGKQ